MMVVNHNGDPVAEYEDASTAYNAGLSLWNTLRSEGKRQETVDVWEQIPGCPLLLFMNGRDARNNADILRTKLNKTARTGV